jgi:hypothetical protein
MFPLLPLEPCENCGKTDKLDFQDNRFYCKECQRVNSDILPVKNGSYFRFSGEWRESKGTRFKCEECKQVFERKYEFVDEKICWKCIKIYFPDSPGSHDLHGLPGLHAIEFPCCTCERVIKVNLYLLLSRFDLKKFIYPRLQKITRALLTQLDIDLENSKGVDPEMLDVIRDKLGTMFIVACNRKCIGKCKNIFLRRICKFVWVPSKIKLICASCGEKEILDSRDNYADAFIFHCRNCFNMRFLESFFQVRRKLNYETEKGMRIYQPKYLKLEGKWIEPPFWY